MFKYDMDLCCHFRKSKDQWGELSNMTGGFPITYKGLVWKSSEALYQAARYPDHPELQEAIRNATNGFTAKLIAKAKYHHTRPDWMSNRNFRIDAMYYALMLKLESNPKLWDVLAATENYDIVENSHKDDYWGAIPNGEGLLIGLNTLGRLWMLIRKDFLKTRTIKYPPQGMFPGQSRYKELF